MVDDLRRVASVAELVLLLVAGSDDHVAHKIAIGIALLEQIALPEVALGGQITKEDFPDESAYSALVGTTLRAKLSELFQVDDIALEQVLDLLESIKKVKVRAQNCLSSSINLDQSYLPQLMLFHSDDQQQKKGGNFTVNRSLNLFDEAAW